MNGYIYILSNPSLPGLLKIGCSKRSGKVRAKELSNTSSPSPFRLVFEVFCEDCFSIGKKVFESLKDSRVSDRREFFEVSDSEAIQNILNIVLDEHDMYCAHKIDMDIVEAFRMLTPKGEHPIVYADKVLGAS